MLGLAVEFRQHRDLDRARLGHDFIRIDEELLARSQVFDCHSQDAIEVLVDVVNVLLQFLPEQLLFVLLGMGTDGTQ